MPKFRLVYFPHGRCWRFRLSRNRYYSGLVTYWGFWRFALIIDRRHLGES